MARTTAAKVKEILDTNLSTAIIDAYILGASTMVTDLLTDSGLSKDMLDEIERWLAAHMVTITRERMSSKIGGGPAPSIEYIGKFGLGLESTPYGQMVLQLDTTSTLASLGMRGASITAITSFD